MKFSTREDVDAPIEATFAMLTDHDSFARQAMRRGAQVQRTDGLKVPGPGMAWEAQFRLRGRQRKIVLLMTRYEPSTEVEVNFVSGGVSGVLAAECVALSRNRTRMQIGLEIKPTTLSARLLVQSLKLAKTSLTKRFKLSVAEYAKTLEARYNSRPV